jgi:hypothetical protein
MVLVNQSDTVIEIDGQLPEPRYYDIDGVKYPSVTSVTGILANPYLEQWRGNIGNEMANAVMKETAAFGDTIHELTAVIDITGVESIEVPGNVVKHITNYVKWRQKGIAEVIEVERLVVSKRYQYAGRLDRVVRIVGDEYLGLLDIKTGSVSPRQGLQTAAYAEAYQEMTNVKIERRGVVRIARISGNVSPYWHLNAGDLGAFLKLREVFEYLRSIGEVS